VNRPDNSWTCSPKEPKSPEEGQCTRESPAKFFDLLNSPKLCLLNIKFPFVFNGPTFLELMPAVRKNCRLGTLTELALTGKQYRLNCEFDVHPTPDLNSRDFLAGLNMLLPLPKLCVLRLTAAPSFLDEFDLSAFQEIASGLPELQKLIIGHTDFPPYTYLGKYPSVANLVAFCSLFPSLEDVSVALLDVERVQEMDSLEWSCPRVKTLTIKWWFIEEEALDCLKCCMKNLFPSARIRKWDRNTFPMQFQPLCCIKSDN
jgi:hypothetical protein